MMKKMILFSTLMLLVSGNSFAWDWHVFANVTEVQSTYMPYFIAFSVDQNAGTCLAGTVLTYNGTTPYPNNSTADLDKKENAKAALSVLLTALVGNKKVQMYGINSGCVVQYLFVEK